MLRWPKRKSTVQPGEAVREYDFIENLAEQESKHASRQYDRFSGQRSAPLSHRRHSLACQKYWIYGCR